MTKIFGIAMMAILLFSSCKKDDDDILEDNNNQNNGSAIAVYNHAYNENYEADQIDYIILNANNAYVLIDPYEDNAFASVEGIQANGNQVGAYISIGTGEDWRDDFQDMEPYLVSEQWGEWDGEYFVNSTTTGIVDIMKARIDQIDSWGCDWVEFDNMDWMYDDDLRAIYGFEVTIAEGIAYYNELCDYVHSKGMKCMSKNLTEQVSNFDGVLYESYDDEKNWWDTAEMQSFVNTGKLSIIVHYNELDCDGVYQDYKDIYGESLSFLCEDVNAQSYVHYNE